MRPLGLHLRPCCAVAALAACLPAQTAPVAAGIQLPATLFTTGVLTADVDADGRSDLVLACRDSSSKRRELRVHLRQAAPPWFRSEPSFPPYAVEQDVVAFAYADCDPAPGRELVLLTPERGVAVVPGADGPRYEPLFERALVWPAPAAGFVLPLPQAGADYDGDGKDDLLVPIPDGAMLHRRGRDAAEFVMPPWRSPIAAVGGGAGGRVQRGRSGVGLSLGVGGDGDAAGGQEADGPLLSSSARAPRFLSLDRFGSGSPGLAAVRNGVLWTWRRSPSGEFASAAMQALPLPADRLVLFDPAFDVQFATVDGDPVPDLLLTTSARRNDEVEVRIDLFRTRADGGFAAVPDGRLRLQAVAGPPQLADVDGDGRLDLAVTTVRTDRLLGMTGDAPKVLEVQLNVFRGTGEGFAQPAALTQLLQVPVQDGQVGEPFLRVLRGAAGAPGAVVLRLQDTLVQRPLRRDGERLQLLPPALRLPIPAGARVRSIDDSRGEATGEVLVVGEHEVLHVAMR